MEREDFTDYEAFRASIQQVDGAWLLNGGNDWRWQRTSLKLGDCVIHNWLFPVRTDHARDIIKRLLQLLDPVQERCLATPRRQARLGKHHGHGAGR
jgi:hypothetical protein